jgi:hypothetical protein
MVIDVLNFCVLGRGGSSSYITSNLGAPAVWNENISTPPCFLTYYCKVDRFRLLGQEGAWFHAAERCRIIISSNGILSCWLDLLPLCVL